jgi:hypothetical protein
VRRVTHTLEIKERFTMMAITVRYLVSAAAVFGATSLLSAQARQAGTKSEAAFKQLSAVVGDWQGVQDGVPIAVKYTLTANGSTLMEEDKPGKKSPMITMFTVDGERLIATHYCSVGNQPQMVSTAPDDFSKGITFSLTRITGMKSSGDWHNTGMTLTLDDEDHMTQRWTYLYKGKPGVTIFHYTRKK